HSSDDGRVGATATQVAAHAFADLGVVDLHRCVRVIGGVAGHARFDLVQHAHRGTDLARCAVPTLVGVMFEEGPGDRVGAFLTLGQAGSGGQVRSVVGHGQGQAGQHATAVEQNGAGPALAVITPLLG